MAELQAWSDGPTKSTIVDFVGRVTAEGGPDYVAPEARVAVFDNDGTLWCEKPMYIQLDFIVRRLSEKAAEDPSLSEQQPYKAASSGDLEWFGGAITKHYQGDDSDLKVLSGAVMSLHASMTVEQHAARVSAFFTEAKHPTLGRLYQTCTYAPMVELLRYLEANGGAGHYPAFAGLVGPGLANGAALGNIFASPSAKQICSVARAASRGGGVLLSFGNYAGDVLHFGQAAEKLNRNGIPTKILAVTDDISSASSDEIQKRRGVAGDLAVFKVAAAAAEEGLTLEEVHRIASRANDRTRTLGVAFTGCTLPGAGEATVYRAARTDGGRYGRPRRTRHRGSRRPHRRRARRTAGDHAARRPAQRHRDR